MVTVRGALCADKPAVSLAATVKVKPVAGANPVTTKLVLVAVPTEAPF